MRFLFDPDSQIMRFLARLADLVILNVVFLFTCLPLFTIGAAVSALYSVVFAMDTQREGKTLPTYFRAFRENFRQGTAIFGILALFGAASCVNMTLFSDMGGMAGFFLFLIAMLVLVMTVLIASFVFPLLSRFRNTVSSMLRNALLLSVSHLPRALLVSVINAFPWVLMLVNFYAFLRLGILWFSLYFSAAAYYNSRLLKKVFDPLEEASEQQPQ